MLGLKSERTKFYFIKPTWADRAGISLDAHQLLYVCISPIVLIIPNNFLMFWAIPHAIFGFFCFADEQIYCDVRLLCEGLKKLEGLSLRQVYKQASLTPFIKFQNFFVSWILAQADYESNQFLLSGYSGIIMLFLLMGNIDPLRIKLLLCTPWFLVTRHLPSHDSIYIHILLVGVASANFAPMITLFSFLFVLWAKCFSIGFPRLIREQVHAIKTFTTNMDYSYLYGHSWRYRLKRFLWVAGTWLPLLFCPWFLLGFAVFFVLRMHQKYYLYLIPLAFL